MAKWEPTTHLKITFKVEMEIRGTSEPTNSLKALRKLSAIDLSTDCAEKLVNLHNEMRIESDYNWEPLLSITKESKSELFRESEKFSRRAKRQFDYFESHFEDEVRAIAAQLLLHEFEVPEGYATGSDIGPPVREFVIQKILKDTATRVKNRLPRFKGRPSTTNTYHYVRDKKVFVDRCLECLAALEKKKRKLSKKSLADEFFPADNSGAIVDNPEKALSYQFKKYKITMKQLLGSFYGTGPDRINLHEDERAQLDRLMQR